MNNNTGIPRISNEQLLLINILNTMYNDNLRQINSITDTLNNFVDTNNQIRNLLIQLLNSSQNNINQNNINQNNINQNNINQNNINQNNINQNNINQNNINQNNRRNRYNDRRDRFNYDRERIYLLSADYSLPLRPTGNYTNRNQNNVFTQLLQNFLQPVEIYPTQTQIEAATRRVRYSDITSPINSRCPISMDNFNDNDMVTVIRHCGHIFNTENLNNWFISNCRCPVCRYDIRDYNSNASTEYFTHNISVSTNNLNDVNNTNNLQRTTSQEGTINNNIDIISTRAIDFSGNLLNISNDILNSYLTNAFSRVNNNQ